MPRAKWSNITARYSTAKTGRERRRFQGKRDAKKGSASDIHGYNPTPEAGQKRAG